MAERPIFLPDERTKDFVAEKTVSFDWHPGFSVQQKQRSIASLHANAKKQNLCQNPLEVSSKSNVDLGVQLSAFNLKLRTEGFDAVSVEVLFQGSKKFEGGGPFNDLYRAHPWDAKKDQRLRSCGSLTSFIFQGREWALQPTTSFYDWLYISALLSNPSLAEQVISYDAFTDIEFNPKRSFNCQARSLALYTSLATAGDVESLVADEDEFIRRCYEAGAQKRQMQGALFD